MLTSLSSFFHKKERRLNFPTYGTFRPLFEAALYPCWRVVVDGRRTLQPLEIEVLIKIYRKRSMGWLIALDKPVFSKPTKPKEPINPTFYYDYAI